tara:strand:- start:149 stop:1090 length:942 start_codon:yes stop_codon:yes gene_type:complete
MKPYINDLLELINHGKVSNTYKMSWIKSIVEICEQHCKKEIHFDELSPIIFKYYWNQTFFFNLYQGNNKKKKPKIIQYVDEEIESYKNKFNTYQPITCIKYQDSIEKSLYKKISTVLKTDVSGKFQNLSGRKYDIYELDEDNRTIKIKHPKVIKEFSKFLYQAINFRWAQLLEDFDGSPRICKKIKGIDRDQTPTKRKSLKRFHKYLDMENPNKICFLDGDEIPNGELSVDHVIPWSYMFEDDLWNLVYVKKGPNSSKGNIIPEESLIVKLEKRNKNLLKILIENGIKGKDVDELQLSIEKDYLRRFWIGYKG